MKHLKLLFLLLVLSSNSIFAQQVNYSQALSDLISTKKWFEIENYYQQHKDSIDSKFVRLWYLAETGNAFNRRYEAIDAYEKLIDTNPLNMDTPTLISLFGQPLGQLYADVQEYAKGEEVCRKLIAIIEKDTILNSDVRLSYIQGFTQAIESFKQFPKTYPKLTITKSEVDTTGEIKLIPMSRNDILFNAKWNGIKLLTLFDTGCGGGGYIYNRAIAEKIGVKFNTTDTIMMNNGNIRCMTGVVDSLELGKFIIRNVPVYVNIETIDPADSDQVKCDSVLNSAFDIVLGIPVIRQLGIIDFDFAKNTMSFSQKIKTNDIPNLYIDKQVLYMNMKICNSNFLAQFDTGGDALSINADFYEKHKQCIFIETQATQSRGAWGGCNEASLRHGYAYNCPQIDININDQEITMINDCSVGKYKENVDIQDTIKYGLIGNAIFKYYKKATFDFVNMVFSVGN